MTEMVREGLRGQVFEGARGERVIGKNKITITYLLSGIYQSVALFSIYDVKTSIRSSLGQSKQQILALKIIFRVEIQN